MLKKNPMINSNDTHENVFTSHLKGLHPGIQFESLSFPFGVVSVYTVLPENGIFINPITDGGGCSTAPPLPKISSKTLKMASK